MEVNLKYETVQLNSQQLAQLFKRNIKTIDKHINNVLNEKTYSDNLVVTKFATVQKEGEREVIRNIEYYNVDMIISIGYRVKSNKAKHFFLKKIIYNYIFSCYNKKKEKEIC